MLKVFGHLNPDTDSTCSPIVYAWLLSRQGTEATAYLLGEPNKEALFVLEKLGVEKPQLLTALTAEDSYVLVDTNNPEELIPSHTEAKLVEVVDHHKLIGGLKTSEPIAMTLRPVACTATIIWQLVQEAGAIDLSKEMAGLLLAAIVSDTLKFTSPTTTQLDREAASMLAAISGLDVEELAEGMFAAKSDLSGMSAQDILLMDSKLFTMNGKKVRVSSLETTKPSVALGMRLELVEAIQELKETEELDALMFFVVDIIGNGSTLILASETEAAIAEKGFGKQPADGLLDLPGVVSRKKQMVPAIEQGVA